MIKVGETAFLKTTGEVVFVLDIQPVSRVPCQGRSFVLGDAFSAQEATVRIPILESGGGIEHRIESFLVEELETAQEKFDRELAQFTELQKRQPLRPLEDAVDAKKRLN